MPGIGGPAGAIRGKELGACRTTRLTSDGIQLAAVLSRRWRPGSGAMCLQTFVIEVLESACTELYRVATLTASEHIAIRTIAAHQRLLPDFLRFGPSISYRTRQLFSI